MTVIVMNGKHYELGSGLVTQDGFYPPDTVRDENQGAPNWGKVKFHNGLSMVMSVHMEGGSWQIQMVCQVTEALL